MKRINFYCSFILSLFSIITSDLQSQWIFTGSVAGCGNIPVISVPDCSTIVAGGGTTNQPKIYVSTNGGGSFSDVTGNMTGPEITCIWAISKDTIFAGDGGGTSGNARVWKTVNGGINWTIILTTGGYLGYINGIAFVRPSQRNGIVLSRPTTTGAPFWYAKTRDGGTNWIVTSSPPAVTVIGSLNTLFILDSNYYGFGLQNSPPRIAVTTSGGAAWNMLIPVGIGGTYVSGLALKYGIGVASGNTLATTISKSNDGGTTWFSQSIGSGVSGFSTLEWLWGTNYFFLSGTVGAGGVIKMSTDNGTTWTQMTTSGITGITSMDINRNTALNQFCGAAISSDGSIIKYFGTLNGVSLSNHDIPNSYVLEQNYPNPFNPKTNIRFAVPSIVKSATPNVKLMVYDLLGNQVAVLVNEKLTPGVYEVEFDGSNYASGVYYYRLAVGGFLDTKKMVLLK